MAPSPFFTISQTAAGLLRRESDSSSTSSSSASPSASSTTSRNTLSSSTKSALPNFAIAIIIVASAALLTVVGITTFCILRRRRRRQQQQRGHMAYDEDSWRDSFIPNNFKVIGGVYSKRASRPHSSNERRTGSSIKGILSSSSSSPTTTQRSGSGGSISPYQPTTEYGQYRPPIPQPAYRPGSPATRPHNPANLVRHARDKSLPLVPDNLP